MCKFAPNNRVRKNRLYTRSIASPARVRVFNLYAAAATPGPGLSDRYAAARAKSPVINQRVYVRRLVTDLSPVAELETVSCESVTVLLSDSPGGGLGFRPVAVTVTVLP